MILIPYIIVFIILLFFAVIDFKKTFLFFAVFKLLLNQDVYLAIDPTIPFEAAANIFFFCLFVFNGYLMSFKNYPLKKSVIVSLLSVALAVTFSDYSKFSEINVLFQYVFNVLVFPYILFVIIKNKTDLRYVVINMILFTILIVGYAIYESFIQANPIRVGQGLIIGKLDFIFRERIGLYRASSLFSYPTSFSGVSVFFLFFFLFLIKYKELLFNKKLKIFIYFSTILAITGIALSLTRSGILIFILFVFGFLKIRRLINPFIFIVILLFLLIGYPFLFDMFDKLILSIFGWGESISGSSLEMRLTQYEIAIKLASENPFFGSGLTAITSQNIFAGFESQIYGYESIWIPIVIKTGLFGVFSYLYLFYIVNKKLFKNIYFSEHLYLIIAWLGLVSMTSLPGINESFILFILILIFKIIMLVANKENDYKIPTDIFTK